MKYKTKSKVTEKMYGWTRLDVQRYKLLIKRHSLQKIRNNNLKNKFTKIVVTKYIKAMHESFQSFCGTTKRRTGVLWLVRSFELYKIQN